MIIASSQLVANPLVSVVIATYNQVKYMRVCHKSVTHPFFVCVSIYSS